MLEAKIFKNGGSQAVRLPKAVRFDTDTVKIKETPMGLLLIADPANFWQNWLDQLHQHEWTVDIDEIEDLPNEERDWDGLFT